MTRNLCPALPALVLLLSAVGLGVPASSAQSKGTGKKKTITSESAKSSSSKTAAKTAAKAGSAKAPAAKKAAGATTKSTPRAGASSSMRTGKRTGGRTRRQPGQKAPTSERVSEIQSALAKDGSFAGTADGKWDDDTIVAMRKFQVSHGLNPTGRLDALTLQKLGLGSQTSGVAPPTPPPGAVSRLSSSVIATTSPSETARQ